MKIKKLQKVIVLASCMMCFLLLPACDSKKGQDSAKDGKSGGSGLVKTIASDDTTGQQDTVSTVSTEAILTENTESTENTEHDATDNETRTGTIEYLDSLQGATEGWDTNDWIVWANDMYDRACTMESDYEFCSIFPLDTENSIQVNGMPYYYCTTFSSIEEAMADYYSLFSKTDRENKYHDIMMEDNGKLYVAPASRGTDMMYKGYSVVSMGDIGDSSVTFNVETYYYDENYFGNDDMEEHVITVNTTISFVIENGIWKILDFSLPY